MISRVDQSVDQLIMKGRVSKVIGGHRLSRTLESGFLFGASRTASVTNLHDLLFCMPQDMLKSIYNQPMMLTTEEREIPTRKMAYGLKKCFNEFKSLSTSWPCGKIAKTSSACCSAIANAHGHVPNTPGHYPATCQVHERWETARIIADLHIIATGC